MAQAISRCKSIWKVLNSTLGCKLESTYVKLLINSKSNSETISGFKNITQKFNNHFANIGNTYGDNFF